VREGSSEAQKSPLNDKGDLVFLADDSFTVNEWPVLP